VHFVIFEKNSTFPAGEEVLNQLIVQDPTAQKAEMHGLGNLTQDEIDNGANYMSIMYENLAVLNEATK
jgi:zinc transport system substrate-binding protein